MGATIAINKEYVTVAEAAKILGISKYRVYQLICGRWRKSRDGRYFTPAEITNVLEFHKIKYTWYLIQYKELIQYKLNRSKANANT